MVQKGPCKTNREMNWIQRILPKRDPQAELEIDQSIHDMTILMQETEDMAWDRDIEYRAQEMIREYNKGKAEYEIRWWGKDIPEWLEYNPIIIAPLPRKLVYMVYNQSTAKYRDTSTMEKAVEDRYDELLKEQEK